MRQLYFLIPITLFFASCSEELLKGDAVLDSVNTYIQEYPDSALQVLDTYIINPKDEFNYNRYLLYRVRAKDIGRKDISVDLDIQDVYEYFNHQKHAELTRFSAFYCGRVLQKNKKYDQAIIYYNIAKSNAEENNDKYSLGLVLMSIGEMKLEQLLLKDAKIKLLMASNIFQQTKCYRNEINTSKLLSVYYLLNRQTDSAFYFYDKGLELAIKHDDIREEATIIHNKGVIYDDIGDYQNAILSYKQALKLDSASIYQKR